jgi:hypothetical protein
MIKNVPQSQETFAELFMGTLCAAGDICGAFHGNSLRSWFYKKYKIRLVV